MPMMSQVHGRAAEGTTASEEACREVGRGACQW
jgi:hypothetical protein